MPNVNHMYRTDIPDERILRKAKRRVRAKKGFFGHFISYLAVISFIYMLNQLTSPEFSWWMLAAGGWGIGLVIHYFTVFGILGLGSKEWEERQLAREIERLEDEEDLYYEYDRLESPEDTLDLNRPERMRRTLDNRDLA